MGSRFFRYHQKCLRKGGALSSEYKIVFREENGPLANLEVEHGRLRKEVEKMIAQVGITGGVCSEEEFLSADDVLIL